MFCGKVFTKSLVFETDFITIYNIQKKKIFNVPYALIQNIVYFTLFINEELMNGFIVAYTLSVPEVTLRT